MLRFQGISLSGWKLLGLAVVGTLVLLMLSALVVWVALALLVLMVLFAVHAIYLPRLSVRLGVSTLALSALLLPLLVLLAWALVRAPAAAALYGTGAWLLAVAVPQLMLRNVTRKLLQGLARTSPEQGSHSSTVPGRVLQPVSCGKCGWTKFTDPSLPAGTCLRCNAPLKPAE